MLTGTRFFPELVSGPFHHGLVIVFTAAVIMAAVAALTSLLRGARHVPTRSHPAHERISP